MTASRCGDELASIPLMWSEARASLHLALLKREIGREDGEIIHDRLENCPVDRVDPPELGCSAAAWSRWMPDFEAVLPGSALS